MLASFLLIPVSRGNGRAFSEIFTPTQQPQHCAVLLYQLILSISKPSAFPLQQKKQNKKKLKLEKKKTDLCQQICPEAFNHSSDIRKATETGCCKLFNLNAIYVANYNILLI